EVAAERGRETAHALRELVRLIRERELRAFAPHGLRDAPGDRAVARDADDQGALTGEKTQRFRSSSVAGGARAARRAPGGPRRIGKGESIRRFGGAAGRRHRAAYVLCSRTFTYSTSLSPGCR